MAHRVGTASTREGRFSIADTHDHSTSPNATQVHLGHSVATRWRRARRAGARALLPVHPSSVHTISGPGSAALLVPSARGGQQQVKMLAALSYCKKRCQLKRVRWSLRSRRATRFRPSMARRLLQSIDACQAIQLVSIRSI